MKTRILGAIGVIWGAGIIVYKLFSSPDAGGSSHQSGGIAGLLFGGILLGVGLYYLLKKQKPS